MLCRSSQQSVKPLWLRGVARGTGCPWDWVPLYGCQSPAEVGGATEGWRLLYPAVIHIGNRKNAMSANGVISRNGVIRLHSIVGQYYPTAIEGAGSNRLTEVHYASIRLIRGQTENTVIVRIAIQDDQAIRELAGAIGVTPSTSLGARVHLVASWMQGTIATRVSFTASRIVIAVIKTGERWGKGSGKQGAGREEPSARSSLVRQPPCSAYDLTGN